MSAPRQQGKRPSSSDRVVGSAHKTPSGTAAASAASRSSRSGSKSRGKGSPARDLVSVPAALQQRLIDMMQVAAEQQRPLAEVAGVCLRILMELSDADAAAVYLKDEQTLRCLALEGVYDAREVGTWQTMVDRVMATRRRLTHASVTAIPLGRGAALEGVLVLHGLPKGSTGKGNAGDTLLDLAAANLAASVEYARLVRKHAHKIVRSQQLERIREVLNSVSDERYSMQSVMAPILTLVGAEGGALFFWTGEPARLDTSAFEGSDRLRSQKEWESDCRSYAEEVRRAGEPLIVNPAEFDPPPPQESGTSSHGRTWPTIRCAVGVPVTARGGILGVLMVTDKGDGRPFNHWDLAELASVAQHVAYVVDNLRSLERSSKAVQRLRRLQDVSGILASSLDQRDVRRLATHAATHLLDAETGSLLLLDHVAKELYGDAALGENGDRDRHIRVTLGDGVAGHVAETGEPLLVADAQNDPRCVRNADKNGSIARTMVCVPVRVRDRMLGVLQAVNKRQDGRFDEADLQDFVELGRQVGIAMEKADRYEEMNRLFEGFITAGMTAIESRDPTSSGHSARVALLSGAMAEAVSEAERGPYATVSFGPDELKEIRYAALLHDFGKVGVREHILVKSHKLFDGDVGRLRARFDFIKRTFELRAMQRRLEIVASGESPRTTLLGEVDRSLAKQWADADGMLAFLLNCNEPAGIGTDGLERLHDIAGMQFDYFGEPRPYVTAEEVYALSIPRGTLTPDERLEIERHVTHTHRFLSTIPWSRSLQNVPLIAYRHHEKLDGSGYPLQVSGEMIPVQARIMTICDIYDALTASDRPHKAATTTVRALEILEEEAGQGKVDSHLLEIFMDRKIYAQVRRGEAPVGASPSS